MANSSLNGTAPSPVGQRTRRIALVGELHAIVLGVDVAHVGRDDAGEVERRLGDREGVGGVVDDADRRPVLLAEADQLAAR